MSSPDQVNAHYLGHVVSVAETHQVEASEDIVTRNGIKLIAKGARIDARVRDRLLQHKLNKPLEDCLQVEGGVGAAQLGDTAQALLDRHPVIAALCGKRSTQVVDLLRRQAMSAPMQSLLTVYARHRANKLEHAVCVGLLAHGLSLALRGDVDQQRLLRQAGLLHDVGELYIDPALLDKPGSLAPDQWRHVAAHPIVAERLLKRMDGVGPQVAQAVLQHHERLDGFGYPHGMRVDKLSLPGQILSAAELLVGLLESGGRPLTRARIAMKLIPGEFARGLIDIVATAEVGEDTASAGELAAAIAQAERRLARIGTTLQRFRDSRGVLQDAVQAAGPQIGEIIAQGMVRMQRIQVAFSSTGLDAHEPGQVLARLQAPGDDASTHQEVLIVLRELEWRLKELERESLMRASLLAPNEAPTVQRLVQMLKSR
jgi:HD-GYP domain-containing protein (c-di-GMP phosphodiesterase class II)